MPPPANTASLQTEERSLPFSLASLGLPTTSGVLAGPKPPRRQRAVRRGVPGKDFLQRLREAGL